MGIKKINSKKKIGGGDTNNDVLIVYNLFCYLLLYISFVLSGIATIIFFNACLNLNKVSTGREGTLIDKPIFEYLKKDDIMYIDEYLLNTKSPIFITVVSIFIISFVAILCIRVWWYYYKKDIAFPYEIDNKTFIIASLSYLFTLIIIITYNEFRRVYINKTFLGCDNEYKKDITDDIITHVRNKFLAHYSNNVQRATHLCTTLKNRIIEYTTNIDKDITNEVPIRSRAKKPETEDARNERQMKEKAMQLALDYDAQIQKDLDELNELRDDMINDSKILLREAKRLIAIDVVFESDYSAFEISYEGLEAMRVKLLPHINANEDCRSIYVTVLDISSDIYDKGYNARFKWALDLKDEKEKIAV
jgi:hypothetical protein